MDINDILNLLGSGDGEDDNRKSSFDIDKFKTMIDKYEMSCNYTIGEKKGVTIIIEDWSSEINKNVRLNRVYPFSISHLDLIDPEYRKDVLQQLLEKCVCDENYEVAAELRDAIYLL